VNTGSKARLSNYILRADASRNKDDFRKVEDDHRRSVSREASQTKSYQNGSAYKQMIKTVKHRVDCWNKSGQKLNDTTPVRNSIQAEEPTVSAYNRNPS
jgi:hypothetical protein